MFYLLTFLCYSFLVLGSNTSWFQSYADEPKELILRSLHSADTDWCIDPTETSSQCKSVEITVSKETTAAIRSSSSSIGIQFTQPSNKKIIMCDSWDQTWSEHLLRFNSKRNEALYHQLEVFCEDVVSLVSHPIHIPHSGQISSDQRER